MPQPKALPYYIDFLDCKSNFQEKRKCFSSYDKAAKWGKKSLENFHPDMIKYKQTTAN
jgi:hypothetical protein